MTQCWCMTYTSTFAIATIFRFDTRYQVVATDSVPGYSAIGDSSGFALGPKSCAVAWEKLWPACNAGGGKPDTCSHQGGEARWRLFRSFCSRLRDWETNVQLCFISLSVSQSLPFQFRFILDKLCPWGARHASHLPCAPVRTFWTTPVSGMMSGFLQQRTWAVSTNCQSCMCLLAGNSFVMFHSHMLVAPSCGWQCSFGVLWFVSLNMYIGKNGETVETLPRTLSLQELCTSFYSSSFVL